MQSEFIALQVAIHDLTQLKRVRKKQESLNQICTKLNCVDSNRIKQKSQKAVHEERLKNRTFRNKREHYNFQEQIAKHSMEFV